MKRQCKDNIHYSVFKKRQCQQVIFPDWCQWAEFPSMLWNCDWVTGRATGLWKISSSNPKGSLLGTVSSVQPAVTLKRTVKLYSAWVLQLIKCVFGPVGHGPLTNLPQMCLKFLQLTQLWMHHLIPLLACHTGFAPSFLFSMPEKEARFAIKLPHFIYMVNCGKSTMLTTYLLWSYTLFRYTNSVKTMKELLCSTANKLLQAL